MTYPLKPTPISLWISISLFLPFSLLVSVPLSLLISSLDLLNV